MGYSVYSKDFTATAKGWELFKATLFGKKVISRSMPYIMVAYYYKDKWFITKYEREFK
jgi:hypothetical protein